MTTTSPIGIFDSGVGGTTVWKEISKLLPNEQVIYLADSKNAPYGDKKPEEIVRLSIKNTEFLLKNSCKTIVVACNTATTAAIATLRQKYDIPFIGIEPAIKPAASLTDTNRVGVLATKGTLSSALFHQTANLHAKNIEIMEQRGDGLVELIESGETNSEKTFALLKNYIEPMLEKNIDCLVLGCTHYPYLIPQLKKILPPSVTIIDSGEAVARQTKHVLEKSNLLNTSGTKPINFCYTNYKIHLLQGFINKLELNTWVEFLEF
ncbi:MAG: glutamate racemase [Flavobacteriales bacterium CG_4_9_14_3_um_filter_40_17]|nr:MAG: glutamate racemase [Flavobacteriales bacterium CG_4_9_14_3_um_filter_40_17]